MENICNIVINACKGDDCRSQWPGGRSPAEIVGSNPVGGVNVW